MNDDNDALQAPFGDLLADARTWEAPAPGGTDALLAAIAAERGTAGAPSTPSETPERPADRPRHRVPSSPTDPAGPTSFSERYLAGDELAVRRAGRTLRFLAAAAALVVIAGLAVALTLGGSDDSGDAREVALAGTELAPDASATATVEELGSGVAIELDVSGLPPAEPGTYYQAWLKSPDDQLITIGTFHMRAGDEVVELWAGIDLADYPTLTVTLQQEGAGPASSGQVVLSGQVGP